MNTSPAGIEFIRKNEGVRLSVYDDDGFLAAPAAANVRRLQLGYWHKVGLVTLPLRFS